MHRILLVILAIASSLLLPGGAYAMAALTDSSSSAMLDSNTSTDFGNETNFFRIKNSNSPNPGFTNGTIDINSDAVLMQAYVNNDSTTDLARNVTLTITLPTGFSTAQSATATLRSDNAGSRSDTVSMVDTQPFGLAFDQSAQVFVAKRSGTGDNNFINNATSNFQINGNVMTINLGDWAGGTNQQGEVTVRVLVQRPQPAVTPTTTVTTQTQPVAFACTGLARNTTNNVFTVTTNSQAANATVSSFNFVVKDSSGNIVNNSTLTTNSPSANFNFTQTTPGTYTVTAVANSDKGSTNAATCTQQITVAAPAVLSTTTAAPATTTTLPNTGAGDILGVFSGTSALGAIGHYILRRRR